MAEEAYVDPCVPPSDSTSEPAIDVKADLNDMLNNFPLDQARYTDQIAKLNEQKAHLQAQIETFECMQDYWATITTGIVEGIRHQFNSQYILIHGDPYIMVDVHTGEWKEGNHYNPPGFSPGGTSVQYIVQLTSKGPGATCTYYKCIADHTATEDNMPPASDYWEITTTSDAHHIEKRFDSLYNAKGNLSGNLRGWEIFDTTSGTVLLTFTSGLWNQVNPMASEQFIPFSDDWYNANDFVNQSLNQANYGLKAKVSQIDKAIDWIGKSKQKAIEMVPLLGKLVK